MMLKIKSTVESPLIFLRKDRLDTFIQDTVVKVADFFSVKRQCLPSYCLMINTSKNWWSSGALQVDNIDRWGSSFKKIYSKDQDIELLVDITVDGFKKCANKKDLDKLRGHLFEGIIMGLHGGSTEFLNAYSSSHGWGAQVNIIGDDSTLEQIKYQCTKKEKPSCETRVTIDIGYWDGKNKSGVFYECKVTPENYDCKENMYMQELKGSTSTLGTNVKYYLASPHNESKFNITSPFEKFVDKFGVESIQNSYS